MQDIAMTFREIQDEKQFEIVRDLQQYQNKKLLVD